MKKVNTIQPSFAKLWFKGYMHHVGFIKQNKRSIVERASKNVEAKSSHRRHRKGPIELEVRGLRGCPAHVRVAWTGKGYGVGWCGRPCKVSAGPGHSIPSPNWKGIQVSCDAISHLCLRSLVSWLHIKLVIIMGIGLIQSVEKAEEGNSCCVPKRDEVLAQL